MIKHVLLILTLMFFGCSAITEWHHKDEFEEVAESYKTALRWENFEMAGMFLSKGDKKKAEGFPDISSLQDIKITSYNELNRIINDEEREIKQVVEIKYYNKKQLIEKVVVDNQVWVYEKDKWLLTTGLPDFK